MAKHSKQHSEHNEPAHEIKQESAHKDDIVHSEPKEEVSFDFSKIKNFFSAGNASRNNTLLIILLVLIPVLLTLFIRLQPQYLPQTEEWASSSVTNYYRNQIAASINSQYPNLPAANKQTLIDQQFAEFQKTNSEMISQQIKSTAEFFKSGFRYEENNRSYTFLGDLDSYFFLRYARNMNEKGSYCDEIKDGQCIDNHMYAPLGTPTTPSMHPFGIFYLYKFMHAINANFTLMQAAFLLPTLLAMIAAVAAFFVGKKMMNETAGFFAAMLLALSPMFLSRTLGSDTDIWNIVFPLVFLWIFIYAFEAKSWVKKIILACVSGFVLGLSSFAWVGWWYIFDFTVLALVLYMAFIFLKDFIIRRNMKKSGAEELKLTAIVLAVLFISSAVFVSLFSSVTDFKNAFTEPSSRFQTFKLATHEDYWPNIQTTVAEMNEAGIDSIVSQTSFGVKIFFSLALLGIIFLMVKRKPDTKEYLLLIGSAIIYVFLISTSALTMNIYLYLLLLLIPVAIAMILLLREDDVNVDVKMALLMAIWFVGMILASTKGVRFILLIAPAFAVSMGVAIGYIQQFLSRVITREFKIPATAVKIGVFVLLCFLLITPIRTGISTAESFTPSMTRGWWDTLTQIKNESNSDAIINSWWDFGHWFKYVADRRVTVDGSGQHYQLAHWMGTVLVTPDEQQAVDTLRMLDCGSFNTYETILADLDNHSNSENNNDSENNVLMAVNLTKTIIRQSRAEAKKTLENAGITSLAVEKTINYSFCAPPENFLITSEDMVGKAGVWAHFGLWDFNKAYMVREVRPKNPDEGMRLLKEKFGYTDDQASSIYYELQTLQTDREMNDWISPWPNYFTTDWIGCQVVNAETENANITGNVNGTNVSANVTSAGKKGMLVCTVNSQIGQNNQGTVILEGILFNMDDYTNSTIVVGSYDPTSGRKLGSGNAIPSSYLVLKNQTTERISFNDSTFPFDVLVDFVGNRILLTDPRLSESLFTQLFYLDGRYTTKFEKFSDTTDVTGSRIVVWKVKWD